ncbi:IclR family transcriptional regulator [Micromonospora sp. NPDC005206]|uniref:IclR family transcriptional regulator n=1 Tax=Micromonospora sp. NPDC005206 TaxID=3157022 RepID=UPI0033AF8932
MRNDVAGIGVRGETSLRRGLSLLDTFRRGERELSLTQIARRAGIPKSTAHRLIGELVAWGGLERTEDGLLRLGMRIFELGKSVPLQNELADVARPFLDDLYNITHKTVNLAVAHGLEIVYVEKIEAPDAPTVSRPGERYPIHCTALGKAILAFSPPALSDRVIQRGLIARTSHSITSVALFRKELAGVRSTHLAFDREELVPGLFCIATPIFDSSGHLLGAISVSSLESMAGARNLGPALLTISRAMSRELGEHVVASA